MATCIEGADHEGAGEFNSSFWTWRVTTLRYRSEVDPEPRRGQPSREVSCALTQNGPVSADTGNETGEPSGARTILLWIFSILGGASAVAFLLLVILTGGGLDRDTLKLFDETWLSKPSVSYAFD